MAVSLAALGGIARAFESRNFRLFWVGQLNLVIGAWVYRIAVAWLTWDLTHSTAWLGIVASGTMLPALFLGPLGGATADRYGHRRQLMTSSSFTLTVTLITGLLTVLDMITIHILFALTTAQGLARAFNVPARNALVPTLVDPRHLSAAIGVNSTTYQSGNFLGPAVGGVIIAQFGVAVAFFVYTAGVAIALATLALLRVAPRPARTGPKRSLVHDLGEGLKYTARHGGIRTVLVMAALTALFLQPYQEMLAGVSDLVFARGASGLAMLASAAGLGAMTGGLWLAWRGRTEGLVRIELAAVFVASVALAVFSLSTVFWLSLGALFCIGAALVTASASADSLVQNAVDPSLRARVTAVQAMIHIGLPSVGAIAIGWAGTRFGIQPPLTAAAALAFAVWLVAAPRLWRRRADLEAQRQPPPAKPSAAA